MCGILGIVGEGPVAGEINEGLISLQHRGQDAAGIATCDGRIHEHKGEGLVREVLTDEALLRSTGRYGIGHVRYPTVGGGGVEDAQPFTVPSPFGISMVHNGNVTNYHEMRRELVRDDLRHLQSCCDVEVILHTFARTLEDRVKAAPFALEHLWAAVGECFRRVQGSYSVVALIAGKGIIAFRDPYGIKPIVLGRRRGEGTEALCVASESVALDVLGYEVVRDIAPGEAVFIDLQRNLFTAQVGNAKHHPCVFEWIYFARPESTIDQVNVYKARRRFGRELAHLWKESGGPQADVVIPVPDSSRPAALVMAEELGVPYREGFVKNRYIGRTFIMPGQKARTQSIRMKLNPIRLEFEGKKVLIVDDSIVRGNTSRAIVQMARQAGAKEVYVASYSAPLKHPCLYGIDMSTRAEFIARDLDVEGIRKQIGADYLLYQTIEGMHRAVQEGNEKVTEVCNACFSGNYPTEIDPSVFAEWEADRTGAREG
ncbi:MAG: amidophosphoribosyltransferase, partial [Planctomycetes bacterium]|nr:amidophosphoribosyltransferase [Planctomycetota bacterium]